MTNSPVRLTTAAERSTLVVAQTTTWREFAGLWSSLPDEVYAVLRRGEDAVAVAIHRGAYSDLEMTHTAVREFCRTSGHQLAGPRWEIYGHWQPDPTALETEVYYLLL